ncbi:thioredoxin family protein [Aeoliella mucimassa]|uniref:Thioredoxin-like fold domain-containing protein n=1 Tax=Aeoliella mucimassa TaxID=2527972 RepID=A0A518ARZ8_9BACT|nr:thioredoxin family protein [Aeoliella mucimassa]QDU57501.1 hypothetical protein Pan181_37180 [Aeoliella mucimassa]
MITIQVLGTGCKKCVSLKENVEAAVAELGIEANIVKVDDINDIVQFGVMSTPALAVDGEVKIVGKVATPEEIKAAIA